MGLESVPIGSMVMDTTSPGFMPGSTWRASFVLAGVPVEITSASVDGQGNVTLPAHSKVMLELNHAEAQLISPADYVEYTFDLSTSLGSPAVYFKTSDYIHVRSWSEISYGVNK